MEDTHVIESYVHVCVLTSTSEGTENVDANKHTRIAQILKNNFSEYSKILFNTS